MDREIRCIEPWKTVIGKVNIADLADMDELAGEIFSIITEWDTSVSTNEAITPEQTPLIVKLRDEIITPLVVKYIKETFDYDAVDMRCHTKGLTLIDGPGLGPHYHTNANFGSILYTGHSEAKLLMLDPRNNACRGYPREIRASHFSNFVITPKAGDLYIFPSYIGHCVTAVKNECRASLINDFYLDKY